MNPEPDELSAKHGNLSAEAEKRRAEELEQIHEEILRGKRPLVSPELMDDTGNAGELTAERRLLSMIDYVRRRQSSSASSSAMTSSSVLMETPVWLRDQKKNSRQPTATESGGDEATDAAGSREVESLQRIGRFEIIRELGRGGCGVVFLAFDPQLDRQVAIKVPRPDSLASADGSRRFLREAKAAALLAHPNIVTVFEAGREGPILYISSEWINGSTLSQWIEQHRGSLDFRGAASLVAILADAIQHAHVRNVIHRDLKPANILLDLAKSGSPGDSLSLEELAEHARVSDFGMARLLNDDSRITKTGDLVGTPAYLAPELINSSSDIASPATDIYGLGTILYELLTGQPPFQAATLAATLRAVEIEDPVPPRRIRPELPRDLDAICLKCLEKLPQRRYASAFDLAQDLDRFLAGRSVRARHQTGIERVTKWISRNRAITVAAATVFLSVSVGLVVASSQWFRAERALADVRQERDRAERHLESTETAIDMMLDDVEDALEPISGMQGFRAHLMTRALEMQLELMNDTKADPRQSLKTAAALKRAADIHERIGNTEEALNQLQEVIRILDATPLNDANRAEAIAIGNGARVGIAEILLKQNKFPDVETLMATALQKLGPQPAIENMGASVRRAGMTRAMARAQLALNKPEAARTSLLAAQDAVKRFPLDKDHLPVVKVLSNIQNSLGTGFGWTSDDEWRQSLQHFEESIRLNRVYLTLAPENHTVRSNIVRTQGNMAVRAFSRGSFAESEAWCLATSAEAASLVSDFPLIRRYQEMRLSNLVGLIAVSHHFKRTDDALKYVQEALTLAQKIAQTFGESAITIELLCKVQFNNATVLTDLVNDKEGAEKAYRESVTTSERLVEQFPDVAEYQLLLSEKAGILASVLRQKMNLKNGFEFACLARDGGTKALKARPENLQYRRNLALQHERIVGISVRLGLHDEAISAADAIAELFPKEYEFHRTSARLMARCSTITAENAAAEELAPEQDTPFRDKQILAITDRYEEVSLKHLRNAIALGCSDAASLAKHGAYLSIHDHPEFRKLIGAGE